MSRFDWILLATAVGFAGGWFCTARALAPAVQLVNGTYRNPCCAPVELKDGVLISRSVRVGFELENMKFGLTAFPEIPVEVFDGRIVARPTGATSVILFSENAGTFTLSCGAPCCDSKYRFSRF